MRPPDAPPPRRRTGAGGQTAGVADRGQRTAQPFAERLAQAQTILEPGLSRRLPPYRSATREASLVVNLVVKAGAALTGLRPDRPFMLVARHGDGLQQETYALAGLLACEPCEHVKAKTNVGPVTAVLTYRRADCSDCFQRWADNGPQTGLWVPPAQVVAEDRCDLCDEIAPDGMFTPVMCSLGIFVIGGDVCQACAEVIVGPADCCDVVIGGGADLRPHPGGGYELINERHIALHDDDCDWYAQHHRYRARATNRAERRAALKRARREVRR